MNSDAIQLPDAPGIHGLRFRRFRAGEDFRHMSTILRVSAEVDGTERAETPEELQTLFAHLTNCDPYTDMIFAEVDPGDGREPEVIGYSRGGWRTEGSGERWYSFFVRILPRWRGQEIDRAMLGWMEGRLQQIAAGHPSEIEKYFLISVTQGETSLAAMLEKAGYQPFRYSFEMVRPDLENIPDSPLPDGLEVRPVLPEHYRAIWEADTEAFRDHWGFTEPSEEDYQGWLADKSIFQPELWQVAWDIATDQVAGQVRTYIDHEQNKLYDRQRGWTEFISVRRPYRRRGLARALIARSLQAQKQAGMTESALGVDSENLSGATRVYEDCGFRVVKRNTIYRKPLITTGQT
jgi:ribosomal protein S18 acetylase RimI-like enzyme